MKPLYKNFAYQSPNYNERDPSISLDLIIIHYTAMDSAEAALQWLCNPEAQVSAHYLIDELGAIFSLVSEDKRAWHAGKSIWKGIMDTNSRSIGIELANKGDQPFPRKQMRSLLALLEDITHRNTIPKTHILGHSDVAPLRKTDPGYFFDWGYLAKKGFGFWPRRRAIKQRYFTSLERSLEDMQKDLQTFGYGCPSTNVWNEEMQAYVGAFLLHYCKEEYLLFKEDPLGFYPDIFQKVFQKGKGRRYLKRLLLQKETLSQNIEKTL